MRLDQKRNAIYFDNDDEFYTFAVNPLLTVSNGDNIPYMDWDFTQSYKNALAANTEFIICDDNSMTCKNQSVSYRTITKPVCVKNYNRLYDIMKTRKLREKLKNKQIENNILQ